MSANQNTPPDPLEHGIDPNTSPTDNPNASPDINLKTNTNISPAIDPIINVLFDSAPTPINENLAHRVEVHAQDGQWQSTKIAGLSVCVLEYLGGDSPRMTALFKLGVSADKRDETQTTASNSDAAIPEATASKNSATQISISPVQIPAHNLELLVQHGLVADDDTEYLHPFYIRQPADRSGCNQNFTLHPGSQNKQHNQHQLEFYAATGQLAETDTQRRCINLNDHSLWLPGPVEHTEVMPLHMHDGNNSMLVRWLDSASFRPRLDPMGEEVLVISGTLTDEHGTYAASSWIRNPVAAWQNWGGSAGTLIYYKNGHFGR